jgi:hypothetical protein
VPRGAGLLLVRGEVVTTHEDGLVLLGGAVAAQMDADADAVYVTTLMGSVMTSGAGGWPLKMTP